MKKNLQLVLALILASVFGAVAVSAQEDRRMVNAASSIYVVSAKAGGVNYVEGKVSVARKEGKSGYLLKGDELEIGDRVTTGANSRAEILLNPGSFLRLGENADFEFVTTSLDDLQLKLNAGSAMLEVITDAEFGFSVNTPKAEFEIVKSGVYRINVLNDGAGQIEVWKGIARADKKEVKGGRQATMRGGEVTVGKFERGDKDELELWSQTRAKELVKINAKLQNSAVRNSLLSSYYGLGWNIGNSYGLWIYNAAFGRYCFLPFGYGWNSPYGYYYRRDIWHYNLPPIVYYPTQPQQVVTPHGVGGAGLSPKVRNAQPSREESPVRLAPPYIRVQRDIGTYPADTFSNGDFSTPNLSAPSRVTPVVMAPAPPPPSTSSETLTAPSKVRPN